MYFYEDEVYTIDKKNNVKFGLVLEILEENENYIKGEFSRNFPSQFFQFTPSFPIKIIHNQINN